MSRPVRGLASIATRSRASSRGARCRRDQCEVSHRLLPAMLSSTRGALRCRDQCEVSHRLLHDRRSSHSERFSRSRPVRGLASIATNGVVCLSWCVGLVETSARSRIDCYHPIRPVGAASDRSRPVRGLASIATRFSRVVPVSEIKESRPVRGLASIATRSTLRRSVRYCFRRDQCEVSHRLLRSGERANSANPTNCRDQCEVSHRLLREDRSNFKRKLEVETSARSRIDCYELGVLGAEVDVDGVETSARSRIDCYMPGEMRSDSGTYVSRPVRGLASIAT